MKVEVIETPSLGNRGYLVHDGHTALAVDVQRDFTRWLDVADAAGVSITHVFETHMHNDYVTGGYRLAEAVGAVYIIPSDSGQHFSATYVQDQDKVRVGELEVVALHTPGHTPHHVSYAIRDGQQSIVCTGGSLLYGTVGRTDLISKEQTQQLTADQFTSVHKLRNMLPESTEVLPTHGFGSFCSSSAGSGVSSSTLASEGKMNIAFTHEKDAFIALILSGLGPYPRYYAHMSAINQFGPEQVKPVHIHEYAVEDITHALTDNHTWVVDIRTRTAFAADHPNHAVGIELGSSFATYSGWLIPWSDDIILVGDAEKDITAAYTELSRIGMDAFVAGATVSMDSYFAASERRRYDVKRFSDLKQAIDTGSHPYILDVRLPTDWQESHIKNSHLIPLYDLMSSIDQLPDETPLWVHCASGYRASIAASLIDRSGKTPILINDTFETAQEIGLTQP